MMEMNAGTRVRMACFDAVSPQPIHKQQTKERLAGN
jgi:hypothetical protein